MRSFIVQMQSMAAGRGRLRVEVVYACADEQMLLELEVEPGTTINQAIERSDIARHFPDLDASRAAVGIFGRPAKRDAVLKDGDRVEIYRPLAADPKALRRSRARRRT